MASPIIGITVDSEPPGGYAQHPWYAVRENYCAAIARAGGVPILLPHEADRVADYLAVIAGLVITGGAFDVDPALFGADARHGTVKTKERRTAFELAMTQGAMARDLPILGICGGEQLLNVVLGGSLIQHIPDEIGTEIEHEQKTPRTEPAHRVTVMPGTLLRGIVRKDGLSTNSTHHQAVKDPGDGVVVNATTADGVVEGIEARRFRFCLGVQWHPEFAVDDADALIFDAFVDAST